MQIALISFLSNSINTRILSAYLKKNGYAVTCYFCPDSFNVTNLNALVELLKEKNTSFTGVSLVTDDYIKAVQVTRAIKEHTNIPVIWGGAHVNIKPDESLRHADMICMGEGEEALLELVHQMSKPCNIDLNIKNIWFNTKDGIIKNELRSIEENLDRYPFPDFDFSSQYIMNESGFDAMSEKHLNSEYSIMTSRGCPYNCQYCYNSYRRKQYEGKGKYLRTRSINNVIEELVEAKKQFKDLKEINFWDDSFVARKMEDFVVFKHEYKANIGLPFFALVEPMAFNALKIKVLRESGLTKLQVGIQSGSERVNKDIYNRPVSNNKILEVVNSINNMGIDVIYDLIFNNPYETHDDLAETLNLLSQFPKPFKVQGYNLIFYPGTEITENALRDGYITLKTDSDDFSTIQGSTDSPTSLEMRGKAAVSGRFYAINYDSKNKTYANAVISLLALNHVPRAFFNYFASSETSLKKLQLQLFYSLYTLTSKLKNKF